MKSTYFYVFFILHLLLLKSESSPVARLAHEIPESSHIVKRAAKKDLFVSRGWAAGGMPFSVLYMSPYSSKTPNLAEIGPRPMEFIKEKTKTKKPQKARTFAKSRSVIPQLFVSYGWGPLGRK